jgi:hypothetical protein
MWEKKGRKIGVICIVFIFIMSTCAQVIGSIEQYRGVGGTNSRTNSNDPLIDSNDVKNRLDFLNTTQLKKYSDNDPQPLDPSDSWWNTNWMYRKKITIDHTKVTTDLTNFPVLISLGSDDELRDNAQSTGYDLVFTNKTGIKLNHEIEQFDHETGKLICWVNVTHLSSVTDTVLYMYYGNETCDDQQNVENVWDSSFVMVQHLKEGGMGTRYDSTVNNNDGTTNGYDGDEATLGVIDGCDDFDNINDYLNCGASSSLKPTKITVEAWVKIPVKDINLAILGRWDYGSNNRCYSFYLDGNSALRFSISDDGTFNGPHYDSTSLASNLYSTNVWYYLVGVYNVDTSLFLNGNQVGIKDPAGLTNANIYAGSSPFLLNAHFNNGVATRFFGAVIDEVRISNIDRSASWIKTTYNSANNPSTFFSIGPEESNIVTDEPMIINEIPSNSTLNVHLNPVLSIDVYDHQGNEMNIEFWTNASTNSWHKIGEYTSVDNGTYTCYNTGEIDMYNKQYWWSVNATDPLPQGSGLWMNQTFNFFTIEPSIVSTSPAEKPVVDRRGTQKFQISYTTDVDTLWYLDGVLQQTNTSDDFAAWMFTFNKLGIFNVTAEGGDGALIFRYTWSVQVIINFSGGVQKYGQKLMVPSQTWENNLIFDLSVWKDDNTYFCLYSGDHIDSREVGLAWSSNGLNWTKYTGNPVITPSAGTWDGKEVFWAPSVEKIDGVYWVYYQGISSTGALGSGIARGTNLTQLTKFNGNPIVDDNYELIVKKINDTFWVGYNSYMNMNLLFSDDGETWTYYDDNPVLTGDVHQAHIFIMNGTMYVTMRLTDSCGIAYCRVGDWANLTLSPYNPIIPHGSGWERYVYGPSPIYNNLTDTLDIWYFGTENFATWGESALAFCQLYDVTDKNGAPSISSPEPSNNSTAVSTSLSELSVTLTDFDVDDLMDFSITTVPDIGSETLTGVSSGTYTLSVTNLDYNTVYTWFVNVTDGKTWTNKTYQFTTEPPKIFNPFMSGWQYRKAITIDHTKVMGNLNYLPVLIDITDVDLQENAQVDGDDIIFMDDSGVASRFPYEIESYDHTTGHLVCWVNITHLSVSEDRILYMYYGNPLAEKSQNNAELWGANYVLVQHLNEAGVGIRYDSSIYGNDGVPQGYDGDEAVNGVIDGCDDFDGSNDYITVDNDASLNITDKLTIEAWVQWDGNNAFNYVGIVDRHNPSGSLDSYFFGFNSNSKLHFGTNGGNIQSSQNTWNIGQWYDVAVTYNSDGLLGKLYIDGQEVSLSSNTLDTMEGGNGPLTIGLRQQENLFFNGLIDELRISNVVRNASWISTSYQNQFDSNAFYSLGPEERAIMYVDDDYTSSTPGWGYDHFAVIQDAVDAVDAGGSVMVYDGTYYEDQITINKALTVQGAGWATTIIDGNHASLTSAGCVRIVASGDVTFSGFTVRNAGGPVNGGDYNDDMTNVGIYAQSGSSGATYVISENKILGTNMPDDWEDYGFYTNGGLEHLVFTENIVTEQAGNAVLVERHVGVTDITFNTLDAGCWGIDPVYFMTYGGVDITSLQNVSNNTIDVGTGINPHGQYDNKITAVGFSSAYLGCTGVDDTGKYTMIEVCDNTINNVQAYERGIALDNFAWGDGAGGEISGAVIRGNVITGVSSAAPSFGVRLSGFVSGTVVEENVISGCDMSVLGTSGFYGESTGYPVGTLVYENNFVGNGAGLVWDGVSVFDARFNWWGDASGPYNLVLNPDGLGDEVSDGVSFAPWYIDSERTTLSSPFVVYVDDDYTSSTPGWGYDHFAVIQDAVDAVDAGGSVMVYDGTYYEDQITINKALTVQGAGWATTIIDGNHASLTSAGCVRIVASGDVTFSGFTVRNAGGPVNGGDYNDDMTNVGIYAQSGSSGATYVISENKILGTNMPDDWEDYGFYTNGGLEHLVFTENIVTEQAGNAVLVERHVGVTDITFNTLDAGCWGIDPVYFMTYGGVDITSLQNVSNNTIDVGTGINPHGQYDNKITAVGFSSAYLGCTGVDDTGKYTMIEVCDNTINNVQAYERGIALDNFAWGDGAGGEISGAVIRGNVITGVSSAAPSFGVRLSGFVSGTVVEENVISGCDMSVLGTSGFYGESTGYPVGTLVYENNFVGNGAGLVWDGVSVFDARFNWWGDASGPYNLVLNPDGLGDEVSDGVSFAPWYDAPYPGGSLTSAPPQMSNIVLTNSTPKDTNPIFGWENITVDVTDDVAVSQVRINITYPDMHTENISMISVGEDGYYYNSTLTDVGSYSYFIWGIDTTNVIKTSGINAYTKAPNWDINMDGICNILDVSQISSYWLHVGTPGWIRADINNNGEVNIVDVSAISAYWLHTWS